MTNFRPLKKHFLYCLDQAVERYAIKGAFLDVGCGIGDVSLHLAKKGWKGSAIDTSVEAIEVARNNLSGFKDTITVQNKSSIELSDCFNLIVAFDVIEHIENDTEVIAQLHSRLEPGGHMVIIVPSNPTEWGWDDDFYGHYRRYEPDQIRGILSANGFEVLEIWDCTFPFYWLMRKIYLAALHPPNRSEQKSLATARSSLNSAWQPSPGSSAIASIPFIWELMSRLQFSLFRGFAARGCEILVVAQRKSDGAAKRSGGTR